MKNKSFYYLCFILLFSLSSFADNSANNTNVDLDVPTTQTRLKQKLNSFTKNISFYYSLTSLGPSLSNKYENGATYNRFKRSQDWKGDDTDATGSYQLYHAISLGYKINKEWKVSYSYTFQDDYNDNIEYDVYNKDGSIYGTYKRDKGLSYNNQRLHLFGNNLYSNNYFFLMSNFFYEFPTTDFSKDSDMLYGIGVQPIIGIYSRIPNLYHGIKASIQRNYFKRQEYTYQCGTALCTDKYQTLKASITGYIGYNITDKLLVESDFIFDWDKQGDQAELSNLHKFNANMDDVVEIGPKYYPGNNMSFGARLQYALNKLSAETSAFLFDFSIFI